MFIYKIAEPDEALVISGFGAHRQTEATETGFKVIVGKGAVVIPFLQRARRLSLSIHETELDVRCVTNQGIPVDVKAVVLYKVADDFQSISNAARRFLDRTADDMDRKVHNVFAGHLRSIVGSLTVEELIRNRDKLTQSTRESSANEMGKLGLTIDSLQVQEIDDPTGYIENLAKPHQAAVERDARLAAASADQQATQGEQAANAEKAKSVSASAIQQAQAKADADKAQAEADQAGPLAAATAQQAVIEQETKAAELEAQRTEQKLQAEVRKPADAAAYQTRVVAEAEKAASIARAEAQAQQITLKATADAEATTKTGKADGEAAKARGLAQAEVVKATGQAEANVTEAKGLAEGAAISARSSALSENPESVIQMQVAERLPDIIAGAAHLYDNVGTMMVLNGADGLGDGFAKVIGMGMTALPMIHEAFRATGGSDTEAAVASHRGGGTATVERPKARVKPSARTDEQH